MTDVDMMGPVKEQFLGTISKIQEIDEQLDPESAGRARVLNQAIADNNDLVTKSEQDLRTFIEELDPQGKVGVLSHLTRLIKREFSQMIDEFVKANIVEAEPVSEEQAKILTAERNKMVEQARAARGFLTAFGVSEEELPKVPQAKRGRKPGQTLGPRLVGEFQWQIDGVAVQGVKLGDLQKELGADSVSTIRSQIEKSHEKFDWKSPPSTIEFEIEVEENDVKVVKNVVGRLTTKDSTASDDEPDEEGDEPEVDMDDFTFEEDAE